MPVSLLLSGGRKQRISRQIVGHVPQADLGPDPNEADSPYDGTASSHRHDPKDMFNPAAHPRSASVAESFSGTQLLMPTAFALNVLAKVLVGKRLQRFFGTIGGICIDV